MAKKKKRWHGDIFVSCNQHFTLVICSLPSLTAKNLAVDEFVVLKEHHMFTRKNNAFIKLTAVTDVTKVCHILSSNMTFIFSVISKTHFIILSYFYHFAFHIHQ